ncbi:TetR/AcrR family transcriptional regulator [Microlunatus flavus]|uniref:TetR/AcrR family transcriptional regulator, lmrAB and yxaGH operons repressor n=1 Tax=Microlunatus flavus TaxID=1036181 RepID=A0A1H9L7X6_9ACTN|nr:TetR/AcrR family transcriptional regulator [Microlunatus flavus]SER07329.1 TetR/AcrR family transcriptional regulator, lmrAB and yxaGH operons repressor [Microlunatus flavus]
MEAAVELFSRQGYEATGVKDIAVAASAPMGSFYFHFPGGKQELCVAALGLGADAFAATLRRTLEIEPVEDALAACPLLLAEALPKSDWADGCPVATTALESVTRAPALRAAAAEAFSRWKDVVGQRLVEAGMTTERAEELASSAIALIEGAEMLARVEADPAPLLHAASTLRTLTRVAMLESAAQA